MSNFTTLYLTNPLGIPLNTFKEIWQFNLFNFALWGIFILEGIIFLFLIILIIEEKMIEDHFMLLL